MIKLRLERYDIMPIGMNNGLTITSNHHGGITLMVWDTPDRAMSTHIKREDIANIIKYIEYFNS